MALLPWISSVVLIAGLVINWWIHSQYHLDVMVGESQATQVPDPEEKPLISVVVPARNEARNIERCVTRLLAQDYDPFEVIVVDDRSSDNTPLILANLKASMPLESSRMRVLSGQELPKGWAGKPHALFQGAEAASGSWLCFIDADTFAAPNLLSAALASAQEQGADLFTILTGQELGSFWERVVLPVVFTALSVGFSPRRVNDPSKPDAIANGQFILIRRKVYSAVGGHAAIRDQIVEDKALAQQVKGAGYKLVIADGRQVAHTRMYTSFPEIWEGWTKNIYLGMRDRLGLLLFGGLVGLAGALLLPLWLFGGLFWLVQAGGTAAGVVTSEAALLWGYVLWKRLQVAVGFQISGWYALSLPLGALVFTGMLFRSAFRVLSGKGVTWKGRTYP
jgi:chlorobactene glucosyltransferase